MKDGNLRLRGKGLYLRYPREGDFDEVSKLIKHRSGPYRNFYPAGYDRETFDALLAEMQSDAIEPFYICLDRDSRIVGTITLSQIFRKRFQNAYLGYMLGPEYTGNGYMTEAVRLILKFAFRTLMLHRVEANVQPKNVRSIAVLERSGFTKEGFSRRYLKIGGRWRDHERWAIIREDWKNK